MICPYGFKFGDLNCEECDHKHYEPSDRVNAQGIRMAHEWCDLQEAQPT